MSGTVGPKTQFFRYRIDLPAGQTYVEYQDKNGINQNLFYFLKIPSQVSIECATYGTIYINGVRFFAINESCPGNTICLQESILINNGKC